MRDAVLSCLRLLSLYHPLRDLRRDWRFRAASREAERSWRRHGCPAPAPDSVKYQCIREFAREHRTPVLLETGTFYGHAIFSLRQDFRDIHSIELAPALHKQNQRELGHLAHIRLHLGDSGEILPRLLPGLADATLFWLDGHYCAGPSARRPRHADPRGTGVPARPATRPECRAD